jgi:hypothetical protein
LKRIRGEVKDVLAALEGLDPRGRDEQGKGFPDLYFQGFFI